MELLLVLRNLSSKIGYEIAGGAEANRRLAADATLYFNSKDLSLLLCVSRPKA